MAIYMKVPDTKGTVTARGYENEIELNSLQFSASHPVITGQIAGQRLVDPSLSEVVITKRLDLSSSSLLRFTLDHRFLDKLTFNFTRTSAGATETFLQIVLRETLLTGYSFSSSGDIPVESLSINYIAIEFVHFAVDAAGRTVSGGPDGVFWHLHNASQRI